MKYIIANTGPVMIRETIPAVGQFDFPPNSKIEIKDRNGVSAKQLAESIIRDRNLGTNDTLKLIVTDETKEKK